MNSKYPGFCLKWRQNWAITRGNPGLSWVFSLLMGRIPKIIWKNTLGFQKPGYTLGYPEYRIHMWSLQWWILSLVSFVVGWHFDLSCCEVWCLVWTWPMAIRVETEKQKCFSEKLLGENLFYLDMILFDKCVKDFHCSLPTSLRPNHAQTHYR